MRSFSGQLLRAKRHERGTRVERLAVAVNKSVTAIHFYETGRVCPPLPVALALADALSCDLAEFLIDDEAKATTDAAVA